MNRAAFYAYLRSNKSDTFGNSLSKGQVQGMEGIFDAFEERGDGEETTLAYALATAYHETGKGMVPIKETVMPWHRDKHPTDAQVIARLDRWAKKTGCTKNIYWRAHPKTGKAYFGRGHVQLTWIDNYSGSSADAGTDLVHNPDAMLNPQISARVLIAGLRDGRWNGHGKGIAFYLSGVPDLKNARRTVNVTDAWDTVAGYYEDFLAAVGAGGGTNHAEKPQDAPETALPIDVPDDTGMADTPASGLLSALIEFILKLLKGSRK